MKSVPPKGSTDLEQIAEYERKIVALMTKLKFSRHLTDQYIVQKHRSGTKFNDVMREHDIQ